VNEPPVPRPGWEMWKRFALATAIIAVLTASATATAGLLEVNQFAKDIRQSPAPDTGRALTAADAGAPQTIMVLGSDHRSTDGGVPGNSDTMLLVRLDPGKAATTLLSVPRDLKVTIVAPRRKGGVQTAKINAAYSLGGTRLALETVKQALGGIEINHVVNLHFGGFRKLVDYFGCILVDVDRRYFNDNSGGGEPYAQIDIQPGYQKLCGYDALAYVRFRHEDNDLVRAARQQDFLRQAKDQIGVQRVIDDRHSLTRIFGRYTETDIRGEVDLLRIFKLVAFSIGHPVHEVKFRATPGPSYVTATPGQIRTTVKEFLDARTTPGPRGTLAPTAAERTAGRTAARKRRRTTVPGGLENAKSEGETGAIAIAPKMPFPVYYPTLRTVGAQYSDLPHSYVLIDQRKRPHPAYRMVLKKGLVGEYYGVQGIAWKDAPILAHPSETRTIRGRKFYLYKDGNRLRLVALRTKRTTYWVSNTLLLSLSNTQMLAIASSLQRLGR
jgi:LCP family protein required for cell wall assembly